MEKTANQLHREYKKSGGTLGFKDWINRDKKKDFMNFTGETVVPVNKPLSDSINQTIDSLHREAGYQDAKNPDYVLGIPKSIAIAAGIFLVSGTILYIAYNYK